MDDRRKDDQNRVRIEAIARNVEEHVGTIPTWREALEKWQEDVEERNRRRLKRLGRQITACGVAFCLVMLATGVGFIVLNNKRVGDLQTSRLTNLKLSCDDMNELRATLTILAVSLGGPPDRVEQRLPRVPSCLLYAERALGGNRLPFNDEAVYQQKHLRLKAAPLPLPG